LRFQSTGKKQISSMSITAAADNVQAAASEEVPQALLTRARAVAAEHKQLTEKLADGFDTRSAKKLGEYSPIVNALGAWNKANEVSSTHEKQQRRSV
jgi:hypothetical protein